MGTRVSDKACDIAGDAGERQRLEGVIFGRNGVGVALGADAAAVDCAALLAGEESGPLAVPSGKVGTENKYLGCHAILRAKRWHEVPSPSPPRSSMC